MKSVKSAVESLKGLCEKYPAVVSGYFLVGYSFIAIIRMLIRAKKGNLFVEDLYDVFSALPFMWLLALSIVQIIRERSRLRQMQNELAREQLQRQITEIQLSALKEAEKVLQHKINNPLAVIALSLSRLKRAVQVDPELLDETNDIECASQRIGTVLTDFSRTQLR
jgi:signal transduction histidine kinase